MKNRVPTIRIKHRYDRVSVLDGALTGTIGWLQDALDSIPEAHRSTAYLDTQTDEEYGCPTCDLTIFYDRPMTPEEIAADKRQKREWSAAQIARDRAELARLRAKLGE